MDFQIDAVEAQQDTAKILATFQVLPQLTFVLGIFMTLTTTLPKCWGVNDRSPFFLGEAGCSGLSGRHQPSLLSFSIQCQSIKLKASWSTCDATFEESWQMMVGLSSTFPAQIHCLDLKSPILHPFRSRSNGSVCSASGQPAIPADKHAKHQSLLQPTVVRWHCMPPTVVSGLLWHALSMLWRSCSR